MNLNRQWSTAAAVNIKTAARTSEDLPKSLQAEHKQLQEAVAAIEEQQVPRPVGSPGFEALSQQHAFHGSRSLLRETGLNDTDLLVNGVSVDFDKICAKIVTRANEVTNPKMLESYAELFVQLAKLLRSNVEPVKKEREARGAYDIYRDQLQTAQAQLQSFRDRVAGMSDHELQTVKHQEELNELRRHYDERLAALEAAASK